MNNSHDYLNHNPVVELRRQDNQATHPKKQTRQFVDVAYKRVKRQVS